MAEALAIGSSIAGIIGLTIQIAQVAVQFGLDWKNAPEDVKKIIAELQSLNSVLSGTTSMILNPNFIDAFQNQASVLNSQLGTSASSETGTKKMVAACETELKILLVELRKRGEGHRVGWERLKAAFLSKQMRESVENLRRECQILNNMVTIDGTVLGANTFKEIKEARREQQNIKYLVDRLHDCHHNQNLCKEYKAILDWLTPVDYAPQQNDLISRYQEGSGQWLLDSKAFKGWFDGTGTGTNKTLFCQGMPGSGKTMITSFVVHQLQSKFWNNSAVGIAYLYCNFRRQQEQTPTDLLLSLLKQFLEQNSIPDSVKKLYECNKARQTQPSFLDISKALHSAVAGYSRAFLIVDALDECQGSNANGGRWKFLSEILKLQAETKTNIFVTSRYIPEIEKEFERSISIEIRASPSDVRRYVEGNITHAQLPRFVLRDAQLQEEIKSAITKAADGMFLLAQLHLASLFGKRSAKAVRNALEKLPSGSNAYDEAYDNSMKRIEGQAPDSYQLALEAMAWITCAKRRLTTQELQHALAVEIGTTNFAEDNLPELEHIISVCAGLITVDKESNIIRFVHYTAQEFFERGQQKWFPHAQRDIARICVTYLSYKDFEAGPCSSDERFEARLKLYPLYDYAARYWAYHSRGSLIASKDSEELIMAFLQNEAKISGAAQAMRAKVWELGGSGYSQIAINGMIGPHVAAFFGLREAVVSLIDIGYASEGKDRDGRTPLSWAAENGHDAVVALLIDMEGVVPDSKDKHGRTPLFYAAENGHERVVELLLATENVDPNSAEDKHGWMPLSRAARNGHKVVIELLLNIKGVRPDLKCKHGRTPLPYTAANGHDAVVKYMLGLKEIDPNSKDEDGQTPLFHAAKNGHKEAVKLLVAVEGVDPNGKEDKHGRTPLSYAAENGCVAVVEHLLGVEGVDPDSKDDSYARTPLSWAALRGHERVVKLLLAVKDVDPNSKDKHGRTPLSNAALKAHDVVAKQLLAVNGLDPDSKDNQGRAPLSWAASLGHEAIVKLLLAVEGLDPDSKDEQGQTALSCAAGNGHEAVVKLLLTINGVSPDSKTKHGRTPLSYAARNGHEAIVKCLLTVKYVDPDSKGRHDRTPVSYAAEKGHEAIIKLLLAAKADPASEDEYSRTPLAFASGKGHEAVVKLFLATGINPDPNDDFGRTPLIWAAGNGHEAIVKLLLAAGVDPDSNNTHDLTPLSEAAKNGHEAVVKALQSRVTSI